MDLNQRKTTLIHLGTLCNLFARKSTWPGFASGITEKEFEDFDNLVRTIHQKNSWFTEENVRMALGAWAKSLNEKEVGKWLEPYDLKDFPGSKRIGIIGAGNIPMVALHDILCVFISGNRALVKLSSDDNQLIPALINLLCQVFPGVAEKIEFTDGYLKDLDALIATGSNNSARFFEYYFRNIPRIIRKNRNSIAILEGNETPGELEQLGADIFSYFGLGCRNVTKLFVPAGYDMDHFFKGIYSCHSVIHHNKYANNYDYNKAVWLLNNEKLLDNGFVILKEDPQIASPGASIYYEFYNNRAELDQKLSEIREELQCIVSRTDLPFGSTQCPHLWDYADGIDTLKFLGELQTGNI